MEKKVAARVWGSIGVAAFAISSAVSAIQAQPAAGMLPPSFFNREEAVANADLSWNLTYWHPWERFGGTDCTNFVSQAWHFGGGVPMSDSWYLRSSNAWWRGNRDWSQSWTVALEFGSYMVNGRGIASWWQANPAQAFNPAQKGDAILYDWGRGEGWSHLSIEVGWDTTGDKIDQHTTDRYHDPWNIGWRDETDPQIRARMRAFVVHANT